MQFLLFFVPLILRLTLTSAKSSTDMAVYQALLYFGAFFAAIALVRLLGMARADLGPYEQSVQAIWPGYGDAGNSPNLRMPRVAVHILSTSPCLFYQSSLSVPIPDTRFIARILDQQHTTHRVYLELRLAAERKP